MASKRKLRYLIAEKSSKLKQIKNKRELKRAQRWEHAKASLRAKVDAHFGQADTSLATSRCTIAIWRRTRHRC
ncbi:IS5/IS1182 family transposase [Xanthomonas arboricola pv. juglandis]|nr:IS5/IS1182 family transposase [Xanthomonas arboricola pv. juglandis]